ncbi:hypothetical protein Y032_0492g2413 [Ancylostoma ceylanicum]|uniref:Uncharacterized protein n=1 Tax=Ancylostoma ceylanicum TaxID=53326 RepID=A0A016WWS7_9BILA|nr:hypothetical protein Y032_0492g2413 [Ancylostoma ceylanicum]
MLDSSTCSWQCILSMVGVGFFWGATNPLLRLGSKSSVQETNPTAALLALGHAARLVIQLTHDQSDIFGVPHSNSIWRRLLSPFIELTVLLMNWRFSIPFIVNQSASVLFIMLISRYSVSVVVPCVNALQFVFTAIVGHLIAGRLAASVQWTIRAPAKRSRPLSTAVWCSL